MKLPPRLESLSALRSFVDSVALSGTLTPERIFDLKVALSEATANAIEHAKAAVNIELWVLNDGVIVEVTNVGDFGSNLDNEPGRRTRGHGLKLMVCLADEVTFKRETKGKTTVRLTFMRDVGDAPALAEDAAV